MKRLISMGIISGFALFLCLETATAQQKTPPPPPPPPAPAKAQKTEQHIKMVKIDNNGKKVELDTFITGNEPFVWQGDTIGEKKEMKWVTVEGFPIDTTHYFDYKVERDGNNVIIMDGKHGKRIITAPAVPGMPLPPHVMMKKNRNVIDLTDPRIISYDKKIQKDGTEKITIVRKPRPEGEPEVDVMMAPHGNAFFYNSAPGHTKTVKVIKSDDGTTRVIEEDEVIDVKGEAGETKVVEKNGKVMIIKEVKKGDQKEVEVKVEEKTEKK